MKHQKNNKRATTRLELASLRGQGAGRSGGRLTAQLRAHSGTCAQVTVFERTNTQGTWRSVAMR